MTYPIHTGPESLAQLQAYLANPAFSGFIVLADVNTALHCYSKVSGYLPDHQLIEIKHGEANKNLETCAHVWQELTRLKADRYTLLINLGGGMVCDLGGFCAATFKRGIRFLNVPTSLLAQVDAAVGGKVGVDFGELKNHIGLFQNPAGVFIHSGFLNTLPADELKSGYAEVIKHCLIADSARFEKERKIGLFTEDWDSVIEHSVQIKSSIVEADPLEAGYRKVLNFGHTVGHAIESFYLSKPNGEIKHGFAVAAGIICESYISMRRGRLTEDAFDKILIFIFSIFEKLEFKKEDILAISGYAVHDKKNAGSKIMCTLLDGIGNAVFDQPVLESEIIESLEYYSRL